MRPLTDAIPKPMLIVRGRPLIEYPVLACARSGIHRVVINLSWLGAQIREHLGNGDRFGVSIAYSEEAPPPLETAGGIIKALPLLAPGPFAVVNGDVFSDFPLESLRIGADEDAHLVLVPNPPQHPGGDFGLQDGRAQPQAERQYTFSGIAVYRCGFFEGCVPGVQPLKPLLLRSMARGRCGARLYTGIWEDVGTPARLEALNRG